MFYFKDTCGDLLEVTSAGEKFGILVVIQDDISSTVFLEEKSMRDLRDWLTEVLDGGFG